MMQAIHSLCSSNFFVFSLLQEAKVQCGQWVVVINGDICQARHHYHFYNLTRAIVLARRNRKKYFQSATANGQVNSKKTQNATAKQKNYCFTMMCFFIFNDI